MQFIMDTFSVDKADFMSYQVTMKDVDNSEKTMGLYVLTNPIKLEPISTIPSFFMVNKYGEVYDTTEYILVPYIRFITCDPEMNPFSVVDGIPQVNYAKDPLHPYWIGGINYLGVESDQPNKNAFDNFKKLCDPYLLGLGTNWWSQATNHGIRNENTHIPKLGGIGEDLVPNEGTLKTGMFMPSGARYLQARTEALFPTATTNHFLTKITPASDSQPTAKYRYYLSLPESSTSNTQPYILPPLFTDLFSWFNSRPGTDSPYSKTSYCGNAMSVLTFGVKAI